MRRVITPNAILLMSLCGFVLMVFGMNNMYADSDLLRLNLNEKQLNIPKKYFSILGEPSRVIHLIPGADDGIREVLITIPSLEVAKAVPGYNPKNGDYDDYLQVRLVDLTDRERERYLDPDQFADAWHHSTDDWIIENDERDGLVKVYKKIEYPYSWEVFIHNTDSKSLPDDINSFWLAHCLEANSSLTSSGTIVNCRSYAVSGDIGINFRTTGQNVSFVPQLRKYLEDLVLQWRVKAGDSI